MKSRQYTDGRRGGGDERFELEVWLRNESQRYTRAEIAADGQVRRAALLSGQLLLEGKVSKERAGSASSRRQR